MKKTAIVLLMWICAIMSLNAETVVNNGVNVVNESDGNNVVYGTLVPGSGNYPRGMEFEFIQSTFTSECYTYVWSVLDEHDSNVIDDGGVTISTKEVPVHVAKIAFQESGIFTVMLEVYNENDVLLGVFTVEAIVI